MMNINHLLGSYSDVRQPSVTSNTVMSSHLYFGFQLYITVLKPKKTFSIVIKFNKNSKSHSSSVFLFNVSLHRSETLLEMLLQTQQTFGCFLLVKLHAQLEQRNLIGYQIFEPIDQNLVFGMGGQILGIDENALVIFGTAHYVRSQYT